MCSCSVNLERPTLDPGSLYEHLTSCNPGGTWQLHSTTLLRRQDNPPKDCNILRNISFWELGCWTKIVRSAFRHRTCKFKSEFS